MAYGDPKSYTELATVDKGHTGNLKKQGGSYLFGWKQGCERSHFM